MSDDLIERLRATYRKEYAPTGSTVAHPRLVRSVILSTNVLYNPDGPEAADRIERLEAALKRIAAGWPKPMHLARETLAQK